MEKNSYSFNGDVLLSLDYSLSATYLVPTAIIIHLLVDAVGLFFAVRGAFSHRRATKNLVYSLTILGICQKCFTLWTCFEYSPSSSWASRVVLSIYALVTVLFNLEVLKKLLAKISQEVSQRVKYLQYFVVGSYFLLLSLTFIKVGSLGVVSEGILGYNGTVFGVFLCFCIAVEEANQIYMASLITKLAYSTKGNAKIKIDRTAQAGILIAVVVTSVLDLGSFTWVLIVNNNVFGKESVASVVLSQDLMVWHCNLLILTLYFTENLIKVKGSTNSKAAQSPREESPFSIQFEVEKAASPALARKKTTNTILLLNAPAESNSRLAEEPIATIMLAKDVRKSFRSDNKVR